ncbi:uncharacterized protein METZ01_LOCUS112657 [marine metagenome]|uniref:Uncharacterized protein n=1 Tax=marine metagenome TaxID=408172 RepID=A0A381X6F1_9ZZZZ
MAWKGEEAYEDNTVLRFPMVKIVHSLCHSRVTEQIVETNVKA